MKYFTLLAILCLGTLTGCATGVRTEYQDNGYSYSYYPGYYNTIDYYNNYDNAALPIALGLGIGLLNYPYYNNRGYHFHNYSNFYNYHGYHNYGGFHNYRGLHNYGGFHRFH